MKLKALVVAALLALFAVPAMAEDGSLHFQRSAHLAWVQPETGRGYSLGDQFLVSSLDFSALRLGHFTFLGAGVGISWGTAAEHGGSPQLTLVGVLGDWHFFGYQDIGRSFCVGVRYVYCPKTKFQGLALGLSIGWDR